jgi:hypothetical protein
LKQRDLQLNLLAMERDDSFLQLGEARSALETHKREKEELLIQIAMVKAIHTDALKERDE